jgi:uncharacterized surface protein with fasciclin (FAS1) repeats
MRRLLAILAISSALAACGEESAGPKLVEVLETDGRFSTLLRIVREDAASRFYGFMTSNRNLTLFAPPDEAFDALPPGELEAMLASDEAVRMLLAHHLAEPTFPLAELEAKARSDNPLLSVGGCCEVRLTIEGEQLKVNNAAVVEGDIEASNGFIHVIDQVIEFDTEL